MYIRTIPNLQHMVCLFCVFSSQGRIQDLEQYTEVLKAAAKIESSKVSHVEAFYVCICLHAFIIDFFANVNVCTYISIPMCVHVCIAMCMHVCIAMCVHVCIAMCMCVMQCLYTVGGDPLQCHDFVVCRMWGIKQWQTWSR